MHENKINLKAHPVWRKLISIDKDTVLLPNLYKSASAHPPIYLQWGNAAIL